MSAGTTTVLCRLDEIEDGEGRGFILEANGEPQDIFVVREGSAVFGYVNACPHVGTPLDWTPDQFKSEDGIYIQCSTHGALFQIEDGYCIAGPCAGDRLQAIAVEVDPEGRIVATSSEPSQSNIDHTLSR